MLREEIEKVKQIVGEAVAGIKVPEVEVFDDSVLKDEIAKLKDEVINLKGEIKALKVNPELLNKKK